MHLVIPTGLTLSGRSETPWSIFGEQNRASLVSFQRAATLFARSIDIETYDRHAERLREELTLARIAKHSTELDELDVEGILAFAERILPRAADLWVQAQLDQRQRFQQLFFPEGLAFDGQRLVGTAATAPAFSYLREISAGDERVVDLTGIGQCSRRPKAAAACV